MPPKVTKKKDDTKSDTGNTAKLAADFLKEYKAGESSEEENEEEEEEEEMELVR